MDSMLTLRHHVPVIRAWIQIPLLAIEMMQAVSPDGLAVCICIDSRRTLGYPKSKTIVLESGLMGTVKGQAGGGLPCRSLLHGHGHAVVRIIMGETRHCRLALLAATARMCVAPTNSLLYDAHRRP
jgi:hypothetical protein